MRAVACALLVLAAAGCGGDDQKPLIAAGKTAIVRGELAPDVHLFGEPVVTTVDVVVDRAKVDPDDVRLKTDFEPYTVVGQTEEAREDLGGFTHLRYRTTLRCLDVDCIPRTIRGEVTISQTPGLPLFPENQQRDEKRTYVFPPAIVTAGEGEDARTLGRVVWPPLRSLSRINWDDSSVVGQGFPFVSTVTPVPEPGYRISPTLLGLALLAGALALLALPAWLLWERRKGRAPRESAGLALSPLERALALVEWASMRPSVDDRREALEALAHELETGEDDELVRRAREQGWSPPSPAREEMTDLVATVREGDAPAG